jgi:hypothetical protein
MTLQTLTPPIYVGPKVLRDTSATTYTLDANGEYAAWIIQAPKTGTIDRIHFRAEAVTANGDGLRCRIETVSASDGTPSGTLVGGSSEVTHTTTTATSWNRGTAGLGAAVTKGDMIAVKLMSPAAGTTFNGVVRGKLDNNKGPGVDPGNLLVPYIVNAVPTATKVSPGAMAFALEYDDGSIPYTESAIPASSAASTTFNSSSTPDERGNLFQVPAPMRVVGVYHQLVPGGASQTCDIVLYNAAGSALGTISLDLDQYRAAAASSTLHYFATPISLDANTDYRLVLKPTVTSGMSATQYVLDTSAGTTALREAGVGGTTWQLTTRSDAGAWSQTEDTIACLGLIVDQIDDGASGGGSSGFPASSTLGGVLQR